MPLGKQEPSSPAPKRASPHQLAPFHAIDRSGLPEEMAGVRPLKSAPMDMLVMWNDAYAFS
jgi:hypothetical protein